MTKKEKQLAVDSLEWFHCIEVGDGIRTKPLWGVWPEGMTGKSILNNRFKIADEFIKGKSVLDNAAWDGLYSFGCEEMGASRVLAVDSFCWGDIPWGKHNGIGTKKPFDLACKLRESQVQSLWLKPEEISIDSIGLFDIVLVFGLIYHLKNPIQALQCSWNVTKEMMCVETFIDNRFGEEHPYAVFYPGSELNSDSSNWWGPNLNCMNAILSTLDPIPRLVELVDFLPSYGTVGESLGKQVGHRGTFKVWK